MRKLNFAPQTLEGFKEIAKAAEGNAAVLDATKTNNCSIRRLRAGNKPKSNNNRETNTMQIKDLDFEEAPPIPGCEDGDVLLVAKSERGRISVLDRMTGYGHRDTETGFKDADGKFWLASGQFDIRAYPELPVEDAIALIKQRANECQGV